MKEKKDTIFENHDSKSLKKRFKLFFKQEYFTSHINSTIVIISLATNILIWGMLYLFIKPVDFPIIIHYNVYFGVDTVDTWRQVYLLPGIGFFLLIINFLLSRIFFQFQEKMACYLILGASLIIQINLLISSLSIIMINY